MLYQSSYNFVTATISFPTTTSLIFLNFALTWKCCFFYISWALGWEVLRKVIFLDFPIDDWGQHFLTNKWNITSEWRAIHCLRKHSKILWVWEVGSRTSHNRVFVINYIYVSNIKKHVILKFPIVLDFPCFLEFLEIIDHQNKK